MDIKFINLNMWLGGHQMDDLISFLKEEDADIVALQEVNNEHDASLPEKFCSLDVLAKKLHYPYMMFAPAYVQAEDKAAVLNGNAVLSKFSLKEEETIFYDIPFGIRRMKDAETFVSTPRNLQHVIVHPRDCPEIHVFNTQGIWGEDAKDNERRLAMGQKIADAVREYEYVILSGDFNVEAHTKTMGRIENYLANIFKDQMKTSFNMRIKTGGTYGTSVVDMVLISPKIRILEKRCPDIDVSDHLPQVCVFNI